MLDLTFRLGQYTLHSPLAKGGMAQVWKGVHTASMAPVAVKILTGKDARNPGFVAALHNEVRAVAALNHPGIILILDFGEIPPDVPDAYFVPGSPYLVTELASHGSMASIDRQLEWFEIYDLMVALFQALAHAHARGVIHRDVKPGNILLAGSNDMRPGIKLTDFGISHAEDRRLRAPTIAARLSGTPEYMAPEQFDQRWRDYGPWTDLYGAGCVAYELIYGHTPFRGSIPAMVHGHRTQEPALGEPIIVVPDGLDTWLKRMLAKAPSDRFQRAADAAWALSQIAGEPPNPGQPPGLAVLSNLRGSGDGRRATVPLRQGTPEIADLSWTGFESDTVPGDDSVEVSAGVAALSDAPPMPKSFRLPKIPRVIRPLVGAGLGLWGLRAIPFADRDELRDELWQLLGTVRKTGAAHVAVLGGSAGVGKSRLAQWLGEQSEELGVGTLLSAFHRPNGAPGEALGRTFALRLACSDLEPARMTERTAAFLEQIGGKADPYESRALAATIDRALHGDDEPVHTFNSPLERYALLGRVLRRMGRDRPVIVWLDDVNFDPDAVTFVRAFFSDTIAKASRVLFVLTERRDIADSPLGADLAELVAEGLCTQFEVGPLPQDAHFDLVHDHLGIDEKLARQLVVQTGGNPLFTIQLLDDWVQRGLLAVSADGFTLDVGEGALDFPATMRAAWMRRLASTLTRQETVALELPATIGDMISPGEWAEVCRATVIRDPRLLLNRLISVRLARTVRGGWAFVHRQLRESLLEHAADNARAEHHHRAAAALVARLHPKTAHARLAHHLEGAGEPAKARQARIDGARLAGREGDAGTVLRLLQAVEEPTADAWALMARAHRLMGQFDAALEAARRGFHVSDTQHERACVLLERAQIRRGPMDTQTDPGADLRDALVIFQRSDPRRAAECRLVLGEFNLAIGDYDAAAEQLHEALHGAQRLDDRPAIARAQVDLGDLALRSGDPARALELLTHAQPIVADGGNRYEEARLSEIIGDAHRGMDALAAAEKSYTDAAQLYRSVGSPAVTSARVNLALVRLKTGRHRAARRELEAVLPEVERRDWQRLLPSIHILLVPCAAADGDWDSTAEHLRRAKTLVRQQGAIHIDYARAFGEAADRAETAGQTALARDLYLAARRHWVRLGRRTEADSMRAKADALN